MSEELRGCGRASGCVDRDGCGQPQVGEKMGLTELASPFKTTTPKPMAKK